MKKLAPCLGLLFLTASIVPAAPVCASGTLSSFISLGSGGCMIGDTIFSEFRVLTAGITGAIPIMPGAITVSPLTSPPGLSVQSSATASSRQILEALIGFRVSGVTITGTSISLSGVSVSNDGVVTDIQDFCRGGRFMPGTVTGCNGVAGALALVNLGSDSTTFPATTSLDVVHDFTLDGGLSGSASGGTITSRFTVTSTGPPVIPEPSTYLLMASALTAVAFLRKKSKGKQI